MPDSTPLIWKCQQCPNTVEKVRMPASGEAAIRDGVFDVPAGWTRLERSNVFYVFCSWPCLQTFAALWKDITTIETEATDAR